MGELCSGETHGTCDCGVCRCKPGWTGPNCACMESTAGCYPPDVIGGEICSGHGTCVCGACVCEDTLESRYSGKFCEKCPVSLMFLIARVLIKKNSRPVRIDVWNSGTAFSAKCTKLGHLRSQNCAVQTVLRFPCQWANPKLKVNCLISFSTSTRILVHS